MAIMKVNTAAVFINPHSHTVKTKGAILSKLGTEIIPKTRRFMIADFSQLPLQIDQLIQHQVETICIEGGDGTVQGVISACIKRQDEFNPFPKFVLLPGGMTNLAARHYGVKRPTPHKITKILTDPNPVSLSLPLLKIRTDEQSQYGFLFSTGAFATASKYCQEQVHADGYTGAKAIFVTIMRILFGRKDQRAEIFTPSPLSAKFTPHRQENAAKPLPQISGNHVMAIASTLSKLMIGLTPFWSDHADHSQAQNAPRETPISTLVHFTHVRQGARGYIKNLLFMLKSVPSSTRIHKFKMDGFESFESETIILHYTGPMVLDGEFLTPTDGPIHLSTSQPIQFVTGL